MEKEFVESIPVFFEKQIIYSSSFFVFSPSKKWVYIEVSVIVGSE